MGFPDVRLRRLRQTENVRRLTRETKLSVDNLVLPLFVRGGEKVKNPVSSMPGCFQMSVDILEEEVKKVEQHQIPAVILFGIPDKKDEIASGAYDKNGIVQKAVRALKNKFSSIIVITDVCLCEYMTHGHCGVIRKRKGSEVPEVDNDATLELMAKTALSLSEAGADIVAPSAMMDGQVKAIRKTLDENGYTNVSIMSYSAKYASSFYGPFREAAESSPQFGNRRGYQMDVGNSREAMREIALDIEEGADIIMVKPALGYLDIIFRASREFHIPIAAYNVSGEYSMIKAATERGWLDEKSIMIEILTSIKRAGANIIITYWAVEAAKQLAQM